jgi:hypothetical protein
MPVPMEMLAPRALPEQELLRAIQELLVLPET